MTTRRVRQPAHPAGHGIDTVTGHLRGRDIAIALALALLAFVVFNANLRAIPAADTFGARYLPLSLWEHRTLTLDPVATVVAQGRAIDAKEGSVYRAWWILPGVDGALVSFYPVTTPLLVAPLYAPIAAYVHRHGLDAQMRDQVARVMEKLAASALAATAVAMLYLLLRRRAPRGIAFALAIAYAFGTTTWVVSSQALWQHGAGSLAITVAMWLLSGPRGMGRAWAAGTVCALIPCIRQPDAVLAAGLALYALCCWARGRERLAWVVGAAVPALLLIFYNLAVVGPLLGGYALLKTKSLKTFMTLDPAGGLAGLLLSPTHGLFVFSPFLLALVAGAASIVREPRFRGLTLAAGGAALLQLALYSLGDWRQGMSWGPRWLTDSLPILFWMLPPALAPLRLPGRVAFATAVVAAIALEAIGAFWYTGESALPVLAAAPGKLRAAWQLENAPFVAELRHARAPADLFVSLRGNIDRADVLQGDAGGHQVQVLGWALAGAATPAEAALRIDGRLVATTAAFFARDDVAAALGVPAASGWKLTASLRDVKPGTHALAVMVRVKAGSEPRLLAQRMITLDDDAAIPADLAAAARLASARIAQGEQPGGYWLTMYTSAPRYAGPVAELNTFTNAALLDMLDPVADAAGLLESTARARAFLSRQIEADGLVRYHGLPDAPTIGTLGCIITPDTDDTALAWRIAPAQPLARRDRALATMRGFRTADGLYRTWLAPQAEYRCIDPGADPNPADIGIQVHLLMLLATADPPAARQLCTALRAHLDDDRAWVYYRLVPLLIAWRATDARDAGCALAVPSSRLATAIPGQTRWLEAAALLRRARGDGSPVDPAAAQALLRSLAADDFAALSRDPPLLYHNDLSAHVRRYYWSPEFGYALWLRLHYAVARSAALMAHCPPGHGGDGCMTR
ncbi:MAG: hypothetical protein JSR18_02050 [Proteobacteria bacterium]|nr:hypothetical protein [Pseudomonadota bacterium]